MKTDTLINIFSLAWEYGRSIAAVFIVVYIISLAGIWMMGGTGSASSTPQTPPNPAENSSQFAIGPNSTSEPDAVGQREEDTEEEFKAPNMNMQMVIPSLEIQAPITGVESTRPDDYLEPLNNGVALYPSSLPGETGRTIILGHSAPQFWISRNPYDSAFSRINELKRGEEITVTMGGEQHTYRISEEAMVLERGEQLPPSQGTSELVLVTCWPPGMDKQRIAVFAELVN